MSHLDWTDEHLRQRMQEKFGEQDQEYKICFDILQLRHNERLIGKTEDLVKETKALARKTWGLAIATWLLAAAAIISILVQLFLWRWVSPCP